MFERTDFPARVFAVPCGIDFPAAVVTGLLARMKDRPPHEMARVEVFVNTARMARRIKALMTSEGAHFLPRIRLVTDLASDPLAGPTPVSPLARRLELAQLVRRLIEAERSFDAPSHAFDLADSLAGLLDEMQGEGVTPEGLADLDVDKHSEYWRQSQKFLGLVAQYFGSSAPPDTEARQRAAVEKLILQWQHSPPTHPLVIAGSTGSRGTTRLLMEAVARLPQGALILPGFDRDLPTPIWSELDDALTGEDHPQFRFHTLLTNLGLRPDIPDWTDAITPAVPERNALVSLALRPAPVTDGWLAEGPDLTGLDIAAKDLTLIEAPNSRDEALAIALRLRKAAEDGTAAALISPDRTLTRRVTAALSRWGIEPDDSAGTPLAQTPSGRLLRQTSDLLGQPLGSDKLLALLKHPLVCHSQRGAHLLRTRDMELELLRGGPPFPTRADVLDWAAKRSSDTELQAWVIWLLDTLESLAQDIGEVEIELRLDRHISLAERLCAGPGADDTGKLWEKKSGEQAMKSIEGLREAAPNGGALDPAAYSDLIGYVLNQAEVRDPNAPHPGIMIWGTLEARVQGADLVILAGLNDGVWPEMPKPDPWLNRQMRQEAGLLLPERRIGLSAHDLQQAIAAPQVWLTRSKRDAESETVPSRWINRLTNLLAGLEDSGTKALQTMYQNGEEWLALAAALDLPDAPVPAAARPSPQPPVTARPRKLPVTQIEKLIRDPYAIYARYILRLRALDPLHAAPDAALRGRALHEALEIFVKDTANHLPDDAHARLTAFAADVFEQYVPWPAARALWQAKLERATDWFLETEAERRLIAQPRLFEETGAAQLPGLDFTLEGRADRIDLTFDGKAVIYDYKTGVLSSQKVRRHFDKQLALLAAIAHQGGFAALSTTHVHEVAYIGLGSDPKKEGEQYSPADLDKIWDDLASLIGEYMTESKGFSARRAVHETRWEQDYDHLARYGEWDETDTAQAFPVGQS